LFYFTRLIFFLIIVVVDLVLANILEMFWPY